MRWSHLRRAILGLSCAAMAVAGLAAEARAGANPAVPFYGYGAIVAVPNPAVVGDNTHITVTISNTGTDPATNVQVKLSFNDWGVTFFGWQEIATVTIPVIAPGGTATASYDKTFQNRTHTCLEALIVSADQDDDPNDDRGQINLEVVNSGESFSYNVPVKNDGDAPLHLLVDGHAVQGAGGPDGRIKAPPIHEEVVLMPGEEMDVAVEIQFPPGTPVGTMLEYVVDAVDLGSADPFSPANHNHALLRVVYETPRHMKTVALQQLNNLKAQLSDRALKNKVDEIAAKIDRSLNPALWLDDSHIVPGAGAAVFAQEQAALKQLLDLIPRLPAAFRPGVEALAASHVDADRILAQTVARATGNADAIADIASGDADRQAGDYPAAIRAYADAWRAAVR